MLYINEWFPNPVGSDAAGEFVELYNNGATSVSLSGWTLVTGKSKKFSLSGRSIPAHGYLLFKKSETKLALRNADGGLWLYGPNGALVDSGSFQGSAPEGKSFSRINYDTGPAQHFAFTDPTPGAANNVTSDEVSVRNYPRGIPLNHQLENSGFLAIMIGTAALILGLIIYAIRSNEDLSKLFFGENEAAGEGAR